MKPLHSAKCTAWVAMSEHGIIGPYWFEEDGQTVTINSIRYMGLKESGAVEGLTMDRNERDEFRLGMDKLCTQGIRVSCAMQNLCELVRPL